MDRDKLERGVRLFLEGLELESRFSSDDIEKTPARVARAWADDLVGGYALDPVRELTWTSAPPGPGVVIVRRISFSSICAHHLLPFFGLAHVAYLPARRLAGLSKIGRAVDALSRRLQTQENLTASVLGALNEALEPRGVAVLFEAEHTCMTLRGVRKERSRMITTGMTGIYETDTAARGEVLGLLRGGGSTA